MQQYVIFNVLKEYCIPKAKEEEEWVMYMYDILLVIVILNTVFSYLPGTFDSFFQKLCLFESFTVLELTADISFDFSILCVDA